MNLVAIFVCISLIYVELKYYLEETIKRLNDQTKKKRYLQYFFIYLFLFVLPILSYFLHQLTTLQGEDYTYSCFKSGNGYIWELDNCCWMDSNSGSNNDCPFIIDYA